MWIWTVASDICICCRSVLTAMNSTPPSPESTMRLTALQPPPPTPTTRMTARYGDPDAVGTGGADPYSSLGRSTTCGRSASMPTSVSASGSAPAASRAASARSVALNSAASGPSRMLWRFAIAKHLPGEVAVRPGGDPVRVVLEHRRALHRRLGVANRLPDAGVEHERPEVLLEDLDGLTRVQRAGVEHRRKDAFDAHIGVQVLTDHRERVLELDQPAQRQVLALHRDDDAVGGRQRVDREQP